MMRNPDQLALNHALAVCKQHAAALAEALDDLGRCQITAADLDQLGKETRRTLDQFAYRYTRLQDDMGARLFPAALRAMGEDIAPMSVLDRLARLEQLAWLPSADQWLELRRIRNEFTHDYPELPEERFLRLQLAIRSARQAMAIFTVIEQKIQPTLLS
jgi:hypothetical protein